MPFIGTQPEVGGYSVLDALTASATASYTLQLNSANFVPASANQLLVSLNGVIQKPGSSFTVSGSTLTFSSALTSSDSIDFIISMGEPLLIGTPSDATVTGNKLASDISISTTGNIATTGSGTLSVAGNTTLSGTNNLGSNPTVTLGSNATVGTDVDLDTLLSFSSTAFSNDAISYFNVGQIRIALGFTTTAASASTSIYNDYAIASEIQVTGYAHAPRVFVNAKTQYEEAAFLGLITDITLVSGNTYKFKPWISGSSREAAVQSRQIHFMVIGAKA